MIEPIRHKKKTAFFDASPVKKKAKNKLQEKEIPLQPLRRINPCEDLLVWGKCRGFGWWPGRIANLSELSGPLDRADDPTRWIKWSGEEKFTETSTDDMAYFHNFARFFKPNSYARYKSYKLAVSLAVKEAARRCNKEIGSGDDLLAWAQGGFHPEGHTQFHPNPNRKANSVTALEDKSSSRLVKQNGDVLDNRGDRENAVDRVKKNLLGLEEMCLGCGYYDIYSQHPLFVGGLCQSCDQAYREYMYVIDEGGCLSFCCICGAGDEILLCDNQNCCRSFCRVCVDLLIAKGTFASESKKTAWICYLCIEGDSFGVLVRRANWDEKLHHFLINENQALNNEVISLPLPLPTNTRRPVKVLSLFDGIATGFYTLDKLGVHIDCYYASEIDNEAKCVAETRFPNRITHIGDVCDITDQMLAEWGPFDLVIGGSPCNDLSIVNPARKGIWSKEGSGKLFFEYVRVLRSCQLLAAVEGRFVFWMFENVVCMDFESKRTIAHFLQRNPVLLDAKYVSPAHRARYFWGNLPGMGRAMVSTDQHRVELQDCLEPGRTALTKKLQTITTKLKSIRPRGDHGLFNGEVVLQLNQQRDSLWTTEIERVFGFPDHYTDVCNLPRVGRLRLLGKSWSVPVIKHLFSPLKDYFSSKQ